MPHLAVNNLSQWGEHLSAGNSAIDATYVTVIDTTGSGDVFVGANRGHAPDA